MAFYLPAMLKMAEANNVFFEPNTVHKPFDSDPKDIMKIIEKIQMETATKDDIDTFESNFINLGQDKFVRTALRSFKHCTDDKTFYSSSIDTNKHRLARAFVGLIEMLDMHMMIHDIYETAAGGLFIRDRVVPMAYVAGVKNQPEPMAFEWRVLYDKTGIKHILPYYSTVTPDEYLGVFISKDHVRQAYATQEYCGKSYNDIKNATLIVPENSEFDLWAVDIIPCVDDKLALIDMCPAHLSWHYNIFNYGKELNNE